MPVATRSIEQVASDLAHAHRAADRETKAIKLFPSSSEIRLLEASHSAPATGEILPFRFAPDPAAGIDYPSVVILISTSELDDVLSGTLKLPPGWELDQACDL
jgi:hypothetical protein